MRTRRCIGSYCDGARLSINLIGLVMEVSPGTINFFTVTMATLETPATDSVAGVKFTDEHFIISVLKCVLLKIPFDSQ